MSIPPSKDLPVQEIFLDALLTTDSGRIIRGPFINVDVMIDSRRKQSLLQPDCQVIDTTSSRQKNHDARSEDMVRGHLAKYRELYVRCREKRDPSKELRKTKVKDGVLYN